MRPVVYSASSVNSYLACRLQWYFSYVLNEQGEQSDAQAVGIAVHDLAEQTLRAMRVMPSLPDGVVDVEPREAGPAFAVFVRDILPTYRDPVLIEAPFQIEVNGIPFSGIIDSVDHHEVDITTYGDATDQILNHYILRDLKTTGSRPSAGRYRLNMIGYWLGSRDLGYEPHMMQLDYIVRTRQPYYWPEVVPAPTEDDIAWFAATLQTVADGVERGDYRPTGLGTSACSWCPHRASCGPYQRYLKLTSPLRQEVNDAH